MNNNREPSLVDAFIPIVSMLLLLSLSVFYFGNDSSSGPNQIALLISAGVATLIGLKNGFKREEIEQGIVKGISITLGAILILFAVGSLIGTWLLSGTVPTMIYYGLQILNPDLFYVSCSLICAVVAISIGSSWTVAATIGVALMGVANGLDASLPISAGAIISGAYFGDKLSPLSDTTNLSAAVAGTELFSHIRNMLWSTLPAFILSLIAFFFLGFNTSASLDDQRIPQLMNNLENEFFIAWYLLIPLFLTLLLAIRKFPAFPAIGLGALVGGIFAVLFQQELVMSLADKSLSVLSANITVVWRVMFEGFELSTKDAAFNDLLSGGGMGSMLNTIWLIITAMTFGAIMEKVGLLQIIVDRLLALSNKVSSLIISTIFTAFGTNCIAADQYISIVIPGRMFKDSYQQRGLAPENLSRALEDGGTVTSVLVPWNTCAAYMQSVLLVNPLEYAIFCIFNWLTPLIGVISALVGFKVKTLIKPLSKNKAIPEA
ncbi:Na+/H+ antiporter NhaC [Thalassotalea profundi]|uniref:Na+/H+ antiporter NhaC n=1 Tax=Thalassotalea profundi TaxID=2036687 RepID=A0ABQ3IN80_9GAMM|nr:Na+/H+ antiporter NhaC [Thalassotalea profundi]GHE86924.1 Na+/H+ antiporter NhaC [Thalassotalea profundi]